MDKSVPILNPEQLEQLNIMIHSISEENSKKLDDNLNEQMDLSQATIMQLYNMTVAQWNKKQKIINNLCHFSLTMMSTVEYLWGQKNDNEDRIRSAQLVIDSLNRHIQQLGDQNDHFKRKISEAQFQYEEVIIQKQKIQELYHSQSCINFANEGSLEQEISKPEKAEEQKISIDEKYQEFEEEKSRIIEDSLKLLDDKQSEIQFLREENKQLAQKFSSLNEEHQLAKIEVELAEIAVKEALSYKSSSILNSSIQSDLNNYQDQILTTRSHAQFMNGELECISNLNQSLKIEKKNTLMNQLPYIESFKCKTEPSCQLFNDSFDSSAIFAQETTEDVTSENPFKKKTSKISEVSEASLIQDQVLEKQSFSQIRPKENIFNQTKKTVSLQVNLIKDLPKISFEYRKNLYEEEFKPKLKPFKKENLLEKEKEKEKKKAVKPTKKFSKSQIKNPENIKSVKAIVKEPLKAEIKVSNSNSMHKIYNFFSTKLISDRIKSK